MKSDPDLTMLAGCTTVYLEGFECKRPRPLQPRTNPGPSVEQTIERVLAKLEADLRLANLGAAWLPS